MGGREVEEMEEKKKWEGIEEQRRLMD